MAFTSLLSKMSSQQITFPLPTFPSSPPPPSSSNQLALPPQNLLPQPIPPTPDPPPNTNLSSSTNPLSAPSHDKQKWSELFAVKPRNAGVFTPPKITLQFSGKAVLPTEDIYNAGREEWRNYLVGFFLDRPLSYTAVINHLKWLWKPTGGIKIKSTGKVFFFLFSEEEDRNRILCADPVVMRSKVFVIKPWDTGIDSRSVKSVPVWIKLSNLPLYAWSKLGISWLATRIGRFLCMDASTETLDRLQFAKCMVEITPESDMPVEFPAMLPDGTEVMVQVEYIWQPQICVTCKSFGHTSAGCPIVSAAGSKAKVTVDETNNSDGRHGDFVPLRPSTKSDFVRPVMMNNKKFTWKKVVNKKFKKGVAFSNRPVKTKAFDDRRAVVVPVVDGNQFNALSSSDEEDVNGDAEQELEEGEIRRLGEMLTNVFTNNLAGDRWQQSKNTLGGECSGSATSMQQNELSELNEEANTEIGTEGLLAEQKKKSADKNRSSPATTLKPGFLNKLHSPSSANKVVSLSDNVEKNDTTKGQVTDPSSSKKKLKEKQSNPYAHLVPPAAYKAPPPRPTDIIGSHSASPLSASHHGHITRSKKSVLGVGSLFDND